MKNGWQKLQLSECLQFISRGKAPKYVPTSSVAALNQKAIRWDYIETQYLKYHDPDVKIREDIFIRKGDIVVNSTGDITIGRAYYFKKEWPKLFVDSHVTILRLRKDILLPEFLIYLFPLPEYQKQIYSLVTGATGQLELSKSNLSKLEVIVPPIPTQRKIALILFAYDDLIENNTRRIKILEEMAQTIYREWFVEFRALGVELRKATPEEKKLTGKDVFPKGWDVKSVVDAVFVCPKTTVPKDGLKPFVPMASLTDNSMLINDIQFKEGNGGSKFKNGDTLFARITPCLENGKTGFVQFLKSDSEVAFGSTEFMVLRSRTLTPEYVYLMARSNEFRDNAIKSMSGATGRQRVQEDCFQKFFIAQPDNNTLQQFSDLIQPIFRMIYSLSTKNNNLRRTRNLLLPKLISGEIELTLETT
ncbi:MAG: restriction endonuclease subunit S [Chlorobiaceae bacterium]|nr:restriction endonuclease subunit S [Chlorobiaceae bacterium]